MDLSKESQHDVKYYEHSSTNALYFLKLMNEQLMSAWAQEYPEWREDIDAVHQGVKRTSASVCHRFWWPGMQKDVARWCRYCDLCQRHNTQAGAHRSNLHQLPVGAPMERVTFDILSFPDETADGNTCILVVCDYFT